MADIFLSYSSSDRLKAKAVAEAISQHGWSVWWDRKIPLGKSWSEIIKQQLDAARCVIVLWSRESVSSEWVNNEARRGKRRGILIPIIIEETEIPLEFEHMQAAHLMDWESGSAHSEMDELLDHISGVLGAPVEENTASALWPFPRLRLEAEEGVEGGSQAKTEEGPDQQQQKAFTLGAENTPSDLPPLLRPPFLRPRQEVEGGGDDGLQSGTEGESDQQLLQKAMTLWLGSGGAPDQSANAAGYFRDLGERGNETAQLFLGVMYNTGHGVDPDDDEAVKWFRKAVEAVPLDRLGRAEYNLGFMYEEGRGVAQNYSSAAKWYRKAAEQNYPVAQYALGLCYASGRGVVGDDGKAVKWFRKAAAAGQEDAQRELGERGLRW